MTLKARLEEALQITPVDNSRRRDTLNAALNAGPTDAEMEAALRRLIEAREQKAMALAANGQPELAKAEREEMVVLRKLLGGPEAAAGAGARPRQAKLLVSRKNAMLGGAALCAVAATLLFVLRPSSSSTPDVQSPNSQVTVFKDDRTLGNPKAPITVLEYASPSCPHCAKFALEEMPGIKKDLIDTGKVFYIFRVFPIHAPDGAVEGIARCLPPKKYFPYLEMMFRELPQWYSAETKDVRAAIVQLANSQGINSEQAGRCMTDQNVLNRTNEVAQDAVGKYQVDHTPFFVVNGAVMNVPQGQQIGDVLRLRINSLLTTTQ